jgi:hypothetical protein
MHGNSRIPHEMMANMVERYNVIDNKAYKKGEH